MRFIAMDPSGNFLEGKGQTGWVIIKDAEIESFGQINAKDYTHREQYWEAHTDLIETKEIEVVVIENYRLYKNRARSQTNSEMETSKLIGYIEMYCWNKGLNLKKQMASQVKPRFKDKILLHKKFITKDDNGRFYINGVNVSKHIVDALRHALFHILLEERRNQK